MAIAKFPVPAPSRNEASEFPPVALATLGFGWYVRHVANYNVLYGSVGAGLALLVWMYVLAVIMLFGCEFNAAQERMRGARGTCGSW